MDLQYYPEIEGEFLQFPSSNIDQISSPSSSPNAFSQDEPNIDFPVSDWDPSDFDLDGGAETIPVDLPSSSESDLGDSTEFHPLINGMYINYFTLQLLNF